MLTCNYYTSLVGKFPNDVNKVYTSSVYHAQEKEDVQLGAPTLQRNAFKVVNRWKFSHQTKSTTNTKAWGKHIPSIYWLIDWSIE